jgi:peptide/nickel transport system substrate-binding protein
MSGSYNTKSTQLLQRGRFGKDGLSRRRLLFVASTAALGTGTLVACGGRAGSSASKRPASTSQAGTPKRGGVLNVPVVQDFYDFDNSTDGKSNNATELTLKPRLAQSWEASPDATTYTFHLRPGVTFANLPPVKGRPLTSADVKFSYEYYSRTGAAKGKNLKPSLFSYMFAGLVGIDTPDPQTVVVRFGSPFGPFLPYTSSNALPILPREIFDQDGNFSSRMAGTGAFQLNTNTSQHGSQWVFDKNAAYWDTGRPYPNEVRCFVLPDAATQYAAFQTKQIDILQGVQDFNAVAGIKASDPDATLQQSNDPNLAICWLNVRKPPFSDVRLRQAFSAGIDRQEFANVMEGGKSGWPMPESTPDMWTEDEAKQILKHDPAHAKQLLSDAGYPNGLDAELMVLSASQERTAELVQAQLKKVGINLSLQTPDQATADSRLHSGNFTASTAQAFIFADIDSHLYGAFHSGSGSNYIGLNDPKLDQMIEAQRREPDPTKRQGLLKEASRYIALNADMITLFEQARYTFWHSYVKDYADHWMQFDWDGTNIWLAK